MTLDWVGFELLPSTPKGGMAITDLFPADRVEAMRVPLRAASARMGVAMKEPDHIPNTRRALALCAQAQAAGALQAARDVLQDAYWVHERDLEEDAVLAEAARAAGLDADAAVAACDAPAWQERVAQMRAEGQRWGVTGIPAIFLLPEGWTVEGRQGCTGPDPIRVSGAQPIEVLREAVRRVGGQPR